MRIFDRVLKASPTTKLIAAGQLKLYEETKQVLLDDINYVSAKPDGFMVITEGGGSVPKEEWLPDAVAEMDALNAQIAELTALV
jgi:hypothetical protein